MNENSIQGDPGKLYTTKEVAEIFGISVQSVYYWYKLGKLNKTTITQVGNNPVNYYSQKDVVEFLLRTHNGDYQPSSLDCRAALDNMLIDAPLPPTSRYREYDELPNYYERNKDRPVDYNVQPPHELVIAKDVVQHFETRQDYIKNLATLKTIEKNETVVNDPQAMLSEIFKPVPGFDNVSINAEGTRINNCGILQDSFIMRQFTRKRQERRMFKINRKNYYASRLVAKAFIPNPNMFKSVILHDGDACNCVYTNLYWGDSKMVYIQRLKNANLPTDNVLDQKQVIAISGKLRKGVTSKDLSLEYKVSHATITRIRKKYLKEKHGNKRYHTEVKVKVIELIKEGFTPIEISKTLDIAYETIWKWSKMSAEKLLNAPCGHLKIKDIMID